MPITRFDRANMEHLGLLPRAERRSPMHARLRRGTEDSIALWKGVDLIEPRSNSVAPFSASRVSWYYARSSTNEGVAGASILRFRDPRGTPRLERDLAARVSAAELTALPGSFR